MAAAAVASSPPIDLASTATLPVRLGASILDPTKSKKFTSIRYNFKPEVANAKKVKCTIHPYNPREDDELELDLTDGDKAYSYVGKYIDTESNDRYVLLPHGEGKDREMVLERLYGCTDFNLNRLPDGGKAWKMTDKYPPLPTPNDDPLGDAADAGEEPPDEDDPFDYRHFLKRADERSGQQRQPEASQGGKSPAVSSPQAQSSTLSRPSQQQSKQAVNQKKRKAPNPPKPNPKRVKAGMESPPRAEAKADIPTVRVDRKPSLKLPAYEASDGLVIDDETPVLEKPQSAMALALSGQLGTGPISLHSAANSPAGHSHSDDEDEDADADVEDFELPSPTQTHPHRDAKIVESDIRASGDEEDDLDKQLALAMAEDDDAADAAPPAFPQPESDEESEEE